MILKSIGRFLGPWLAFAALSGLGTGFIFGSIITGFGFIATIGTLISGAGDLPKTLAGFSKSFPDYAVLVSCFIGAGLICGFLTGLIFALVDGNGNYWLSVLLLVVAGNLIHPNSFAVTCFFLLPAVAFGFLGGYFPLLCLSNKTLPFHRESQREKLLRQWLRNSWLGNPPSLPKGVGIFLPALLYGVFGIFF